MNTITAIFAPLAICLAMTAIPASADVTKEAIAKINTIRKQKGRKALRLNPALMRAAQRHADELASRGYGTRMTSGGHFGKNGSTHMQRLKRAGFKACTAVENVACGQKDATTLINEWMGSAGHRTNLTNRKIREIGIGWSPPKTWVMVGARPC